MPYFILVLAWAIYFFLHSWLASTSVKSFFEKKLKQRFHLYRFAYTIQSTVGLLVLFYLNGSIEADIFFESKGLVRYISLMLATFGVLVISAAFRQYNIRSFLGLQKEEGVFSSKGILNKVRHPIYSGLILITVGFFLFNPKLPTLISSLCILLYLVIGIWLEEKKLIQQFGATYLEYKKRVPSIIPRWKAQ
jgi:methanethiol S-methyltransferase